MKKKNKNSGNGFKRGVTHVVKNENKTKPKNRSRVFMLALLCGLVFLTGVIIFFSKNQKNSPEKEARAIIERAKEIAEDIPDTSNKRIILYLLENMKIGYSDSAGGAIIPAKTISYFAIATEKEMNRGDIDNKKYSNFMSFNFYDLRDHNAVVVFVNREYARNSDIDLKATALIHELYHSLQAMAGLAKGETYMPENTILEQERSAWISQISLYSNLHPEFFQGTTVDCNTGFIKLASDEYVSKVNKDPYLATLLQIAFCPEAIKKIYTK